eukprot:TRINITY_DN15642_c0_g1_i1.p1 TRINITY_DN15642_c0_g1~~TRINITY_DN15642_c0_g1_i1.p1  ORF type:complete len:275 (-),score=57.78 TRINITY_DN15642_c0_g1_i1:116-940(-)
MAPELFSVRRLASFEADIFSLGVTMFELATDFQLPRDGVKWHRLREDVMTVDGLLQQRNPDLSSDLRGLIAHMMAPAPSRRPKLDFILHFVREKLAMLPPQPLLPSSSSSKLLCTPTPVALHSASRPPPTPTPPLYHSLVSTTPSGNLCHHHYNHQLIYQQQQQQLQMQLQLQQQQQQQLIQAQTPVSTIPQTPSRHQAHSSSMLNNYPATVGSTIATPYHPNSFMTPVSSSRINTAASARSLRTPSSKPRRGEVDPDLLESLQPARKLFSQCS